MYHEMRRTGYPECKTGMGTIELNATGGKFIARYPYPSIAIANNAGQPWEHSFRKNVIAEENL